MGNYADSRDARTDRESSATVPAVAVDPATYDPYGTAATGTTGTSRSFRQRGDVAQKRVNTDSRVRSDANSGTAGAQGSEVGSSMKQSLDTGSNVQDTLQNADAIPQNASWEASRQPVDISSVRSRVMQSIKSNGRQ